MPDQSESVYKLIRGLIKRPDLNTQIVQIKLG